MGFNEFIGKLFGNKATRDMKEIKPWVDKVKAVYPEISKLNNNQLLLLSRSYCSDKDQQMLLHKYNSVFQLQVHVIARMLDFLYLNLLR